jgi:hypothetical protein
LTIGDGLTIGRIGYGAMRLTGKQVWGPYPDHDKGVALLREVVASGVTFLDTADVYGPHTNELLIREALHPYPEDLVIATKGGFVRGGFDYSTLDAVGNPNYLRQSAHLSARRLGVDHLDLYYLHSGRATDAPFEDQVGTLAELRDQGVIRNIGLSNITLEQFDIARDITEIAAVTAHYNLGVRTGQELLRAAAAAGVMFSPWHPITLTEGDRADAVLAAVTPIAERHGATPRQIALAWQLQLSPVTVPIPGTTDAAHLQENLAAGSIRLSGNDISALSTAGQAASVAE